MASNGFTNSEMLAELEILQAPLTRLRYLSLCLDDSTESRDIRHSLAAMLTRASVLSDQLNSRDEETFLRPLEDGTLIHGTS